MLINLNVTPNQTKAAELRIAMKVLRLEKTADQYSFNVDDTDYSIKLVKMNNLTRYDLEISNKKSNDKYLTLTRSDLTHKLFKSEIQEAMNKLEHPYSQQDQFFICING